MVTVITKTIGSGKDYASFTLAEADVPNIVGSRDLVGQDKAVVFEADAGTYSETVTFNGTLATDATRNVTYKPAAGSEHGGNRNAGVILTGGRHSLADDHLRLTGLVVKSSDFYGGDTDGDGISISECIFLGSTGIGWVAFGGDPSSPQIFTNCHFISTGTSSAFVQSASKRDSHAELINCTFTANDIAVTVEYGAVNSGSTLVAINCLSLALKSFALRNGGATVFTGSNNFGGSTDPWPVATQGSPYPITRSTAYDPGAGDFALYVGKNGALLTRPTTM